MSQLGSIFEPERRDLPRGRDLRAEVTVPARACGHPAGYSVEVPRDLPALGGYARRVVSSFDTGDALHLRLPSDFPDGGVLRLRGQGEAPEAAEGSPGDLLLTIHVEPGERTPPPEALTTWSSGQVPAVASASGPPAPTSLVVLVLLVFAAGAALVVLL